jgi:ABC-type sugar transport system ATPase subunit
VSGDGRADVVDGREILAVEAVSKAYGPTVALADVSLSVRAGEIHGLLGENGAGKSTLLKIISGAEAADAGVVRVDGRMLRADPGRVLATGVAMIYQELTLVSELSVAENMHLGALPSRRGLLRANEARRAADAVLRSLGAKDIDVDLPVGRLPLNAQQLVEIGRALVRGAGVIVLDEATSALNSQEVAGLFALLRKLRASGGAILFVSHHLEEVLAICDRVTVMRDGRIVDTRPTSCWTEEQLVRAMLATDLSVAFPYQTREIGPPVLECREVVLPPLLRGVNLSLSCGEIVGVVGVTGAGRSELLRVLAGAAQPTSGEIILQGKTIRPRSPRDGLRAGIAYGPKDRKSEGLWLRGPVLDNLLMGAWRGSSRLGYLPGSPLRRRCRRLLRDLDVKVRDELGPVEHLSGGNQQKVLLGRLMQHRPRVVLLDEPARGLDVGAKSAIYAAIAELAASGAAAVVSSSDLHDIVGVTDRTLVLRRGRIAKEIKRSDYSRERLLEAMSAG